MNFYALRIGKLTAGLKRTIVPGVGNTNSSALTNAGHSRLTKKVTTIMIEIGICILYKDYTMKASNANTALKTCKK